MTSLFFDVSLEGKLTLTGKQATVFLQGLVTQDVVAQEIGTSVYAMFLTRFGKIMSDCVIHKRSAEEFMIFLPLIGKNAVLPLLEKDAALVSCTVIDTTFSYGLFRVVGKDTLVFDHTLKDVVILPTKRRGFSYVDVLVARERYAPVKQKLLEKMSLGTSKEYELLRVRAGIPVYGIDFTSKHTPLEVDTSAVSFTKGCYVGQEIVARLQHIAQGKTPFKLVQLITSCKDVFSVGTKVYEADQEVGTITSSVYDAQKDVVISLAMVRKPFYELSEVVVVGKKSSLNSLQ